MRLRLALFVCVSSLLVANAKTLSLDAVDTTDVVKRSHEDKTKRALRRFGSFPHLALAAQSPAPPGEGDDDTVAGESNKETPQSIEEHTDHMVEKVEASPQQIPHQVRKDTRELRATFLPRFHAERRIVAISLGSVSTAMLWFVLYFSLCYRHDRERIAESLWELEELQKKDPEGWEANLLFGTLDRSRFAKADVLKGLDDGEVLETMEEPDIVIVCQRPDCEKYTDGDQMVSPGHLERIVPWKGNVVNADNPSVQRLSGKHHVELGNLDELMQDKSSCTRERCRKALLCDLYKAIPKLGFESGIFRSIGDDEIFICIKLKRQDWIEKYLHWQHAELQIKWELVKKVDVGSKGVDVSALPPPYVRCDPWIVEHLWKAGIIAENDARCLFNQDKYERQGAIVSGIERTRIIYSQMIMCVNLDHAKKEGLIVDWYPAHNLQWLHRLAVSWANFGRLLDPSFRQPISLLRYYFGARVGFSFAWNGVYCKALLALVPVAIGCELVRSIFSVRQVMSFSVVIIVWSRVAFNLWDREEFYFCKLWNLSDHPDPIQRPEFWGVFAPSPIDSNYKELQYPPWKYSLRMLASTSVCLLFCVFVAGMIFIWVSIFDGRMDVVSSVCLAIQIKVFDFIFNMSAIRLTDWENHKFETQHYESYMWKKVGFQFVNSYCAFFYLAIKQRYTHRGCPAEGCLEVLRYQLSLTLVILSISRIAFVLGELLYVRFSLWWEMRSLQKQLNSRPPKRSHTEEQSKYVLFESREQIEMMLQLMIPLGHVILFGGVAPVIIPFCLAAFTVQMRASAFILVTATKRPFPRKVFGIGPWRRVVSLLMGAGVLFAGFLLVVYGDMFRDEALVTRLCGVLLFCILVVILWILVDLSCPAMGYGALDMQARRERVLSKIQQACARVAHIEHVVADQPTVSRRDSSMLDGASLKATPTMILQATHKSMDEAVEDQRWDDLPQFQDCRSFTSEGDVLA